MFGLITSWNFISREIQKFISVVNLICLFSYLYDFSYVKFYYTVWQNKKEKNEEWNCNRWYIFSQIKQDKC